MSEAMGHAQTTPPPPPSLRLVTEYDERPEDTIVQDRNRIEETITLRDPDSQTLQEAFRDFELDAKNLSDSYKVTGTNLEDGNKIYRIYAERTTDGALTTVDIGLASDGSPDWKMNDTELDLAFQADLVDLIEENIAEARRAA